MNIDEVKLGQRVRLTRKCTLNYGPDVGNEGVVVGIYRKSHPTDHDVISVIWAGFRKGWAYNPDRAAAGCLKEQPAYPGAPKFGEFNGWGVMAEWAELVEEEC